MRRWTIEAQREAAEAKRAADDARGQLWAASGDAALGAVAIAVDVATGGPGLCSTLYAARRLYEAEKRRKPPRRRPGT